VEFSRLLYFLQNLGFHFSNAQAIFISAAAFLDEEDQLLMAMMDNLIVTVNEALALPLKRIIEL